MDKEKIYSLLIGELEKITNSLDVNYNREVARKISEHLNVENYNFLEREIMSRVNELLKNLITITIKNRDDSILLNLMRIYSSNTKFYLDNLDEKRKQYSGLFLDNLNFYVRIIRLITENNMISLDFISIVGDIQNQIIRSKLIVQFQANNLFIAKFKEGSEREIDLPDRKQLNKMDDITGELHSALIELFRQLIRSKRQKYTRRMITTLRKNLFKEARSEKRGGVVEKLLELHREYLAICIEEKDILRFGLFYTLADTLSKIYDPRKGSLDDARIINKEYLPLLTGSIYDSLKLLITTSSDKEFVRETIEDVVDFYKTNSRNFNDYDEEGPCYLLEKIFYSLCCFSLENNYPEIIKIIIKYSVSLPKEYILVGEKPLLPNNAKDILKLLSSKNYSSIDKDNVQIILFLLLISKFYNISNKKDLEKIFEEIREEETICKIILMHKSNFETILKRDDIYNNLFEEILDVNKLLLPNILSQEFLKFVKSSSKDIEEKDGRKDLDVKKVESFVKNLMKSFEENKSIGEIVYITSIGDSQEFNPVHSRTKHDRIWFVDVSGTTAYESDSIGQDFGSDLARYELKILTGKLNEEVKNAKSFENEESFVEEIEVFNGDQLVLLCPFNFSSKIRDITKYDYSQSPSKTFIEVGSKKIQLYLYPDKDRLQKVFLIPRKSIKWERQKFDFDAIEGIQDDTLKFKNKPLEVQFITHKFADAKDKKHISETEVIIQILYKYKIEIKDSSKILAFTY